MKIDLKISNREKMMLIVLGIIMVVGVYYKFVYSKQMTQIKELSAKQEENQGKVNSLQLDKALNEKNKKDIKIVNAKILESTEEFFPSIIEEKILVILDDMINKTNIQCDSISISEATDEALAQKKEEGKPLNTLETMVAQYKALEESKNELNIGKSEDKSNSATDNKATDNKDKVDTEIKKTSISLNFKGTHDDVMRFIDEVKGFYKRIVIKNINITATGDNLSGNMILDFYAVPKFVEEDIDYTKWNFDGDYGKSNMFMGNSPEAVGVAVQGAEASKEYDFLMTVKPISSDLPTIMLGKAKDNSTKSYVYADNGGIEEVQVYFEKKDDKYYYKYKLSKDSYPDDFSRAVEFTPIKGINFKVYSQKRVNDKDLSGANIKVYNNTDLKVTVDLQGDDEKRPRINVFKEKGNIEINKY